jgi:hypothetical protein
MTAEAVLAAGLAGKMAGLRPGAVIVLHQAITDGEGRQIAGPHAVGKIGGRDGGPVVFLTSGTRAGREAIALLEDDLLDIVVDPGGNVVRLGVWE